MTLKQEKKITLEPGRVERLWDSFSVGMAEKCPPAQVGFGRLMFYAGAHALFHEIVLSLNSEEDVKVLNEIHEELNEFIKSVVRPH